MHFSFECEHCVLCSSALLPFYGVCVRACVRVCVCVCVCVCVLNVDRCLRASNSFADFLRLLSQLRPVFFWLDQRWLPSVFFLGEIRILRLISKGMK